MPPPHKPSKEAVIGFFVLSVAIFSGIRGCLNPSSGYPEYNDDIIEPPMPPPIALMDAAVNIETQPPTPTENTVAPPPPPPAETPPLLEVADEEIDGFVITGDLSSSSGETPQ